MRSAFGWVRRTFGPQELVLLLGEIRLTGPFLVRGRIKIIFSPETLVNGAAAAALEVKAYELI
jgi:hypothetical protein